MLHRLFVAASFLRCENEMFLSLSDVIFAAVYLDVFLYKLCQPRSGKIGKQLKRLVHTK